MPIVVANPESASAKAFQKIAEKVIKTIENEQKYLEEQRKKAQEKNQ